MGGVGLIRGQTNMDVETLEIAAVPKDFYATVQFNSRYLNKFTTITPTYGRIELGQVTPPPPLPTFGSLHPLLRGSGSAGCGVGGNILRRAENASEH